MELFLPGLIVLLISGLFAFFVIPRLGPTILIVVSLIALIAAGIHHYTFFSSEYALATWQYGLAAYAPWVILLLALVFIFAAISFFFSSPETKKDVLNAVATPMVAAQNAMEKAANTMPPASTATNPITAGVNNALKTLGVAGAGNAAAGAAANAIARTNQPPSNTGPAAQPGNLNKRNNLANQRKSPLIPGQSFSASEI